MTEREAIEILSRPFSMQEVPKEILDAHRLAIAALEKQEQDRWISVTERLPKPNEYENDVRKYYLVQNEHGDMMVCSWHGSFWMQMYRNTHVEDKVVAWMPLPKPAKIEG